MLQLLEILYPPQNHRYLLKKSGSPGKDTVTVCVEGYYNLTSFYYLRLLTNDYQMQPTKEIEVACIL